MQKYAEKFTGSKKNRIQILEKKTFWANTKTNFRPSLKGSNTFEISCLLL